jgi:flagellar biosynthesis/type III secretory pathway chaperone
MPEDILIENLIKALKYEHKTYSDILKIAEQKTDSLIRNDTAALSAITGQENKMADQTFKLNQVREQIVSKICEELGQDYRTFNIDKLKDKVKVSYKKHLDDIQAKLVEVVDKLKARNNINQKLIENAIKYINFNIELIASPQPSVPLYGRAGQEVSHNTKRSVLDIKY